QELGARPDLREISPLEGRAVLELEVGERRRRAAVALDERGAVADPAEGNRTAAVRCRVGRCTVERAEVGGDDVTRLHGPGADLDLALTCRHIGHALALVAGIEARAVEALGAEVLAPLVRAR